MVTTVRVFAFTDAEGERKKGGEGGGLRMKDFMQKEGAKH